MAQSSDTARFVITGEFRSGEMIKQFEASIGQMSKMASAKLGKVGKEVSASVESGMVKGAEAAGGKMAKGMQKVKTEAKGAGKNIDDMGNKMDKVNADIFTAVKRVLLWGTASRLIYNTYGKIADAVKDVVELNRILVNIEKIRPAGLDVDIISEDILAKAKKYGVAFAEIGETQRTFFQQGFKTAEVIKLTESQLLAVTAAGLTAGEAMELLVSSMTVFNISAQRSITIVDKLQNVQANYAVSTQDLASAMRRVGPVAQELGGDIDHLIGLITTLKESTRKSGEFIGTALTTIFSRTITSVGASQLRRIGVDINETAQILRPIKDIFDEVGRAWANLTDQERISTAFALGARRRYPQVIALFEDYAKALEVAALSTNSFGAALIAQQKEVQSVSRQMSIATESAKQAGIAFVKAFSFSGSIESDFKKIAKAIQDFNNFVKKSARPLANMAKSLAFFGTVAILNVSLGVLAKRISWVGVRALFVAPALTAMSAQMTIASRSAFILGKAINLIGGFLPSIVIATIAFTALEYKINRNNNAIGDLSEGFRGFSEESESVKRTLNEYLSIVKQFTQVEGPKSLVDFLGADFKGGKDSILGYMKAIEGVGEDLEGANFEKFKQAILAVRGPTASVEEAFYDLSQVIGFLQATSSGFRKELEEMSTQANTSRNIITDLAVSLASLFTEGSRFSSEDFLTEAFGKGTLDNIDKRIQDIANEISKAENSFPKMLYTTVDERSDFAAFQDRVFDELEKELLAGNGKFAELAREGGIHGTLFLDAYFASLRESINDSQVEDQLSLLQSIPFFLPLLIKIKKPTKEELNKAFKEGVEALSPENIEKFYLDEYGKKAINLQDFIIQTGDTAVLGSMAKDLAEAYDVELPTIFKRLEDRSNKFGGTLLQLQLKVRALSGSAGFLAENMTTTFKNFVLHTQDSVKLAESLKLAGSSSLYLGGALAKLDFKAVGSRLKASLTQLAKVDTLDEQIKSWERTRDAYEEYLVVLEKDPKTTGLKIQAAIKESDRLSQKIADLTVEQEFLATQTEELNKTIEKEAAAYKNLFTYLQNIENAYGIQKIQIQANTAARKKEIKAMEQYQRALNKIAIQTEKLDVGGSFAEDLALTVKGITKDYQEQAKAILQNIALDENRTRSLKDTLKGYHEALGANNAFLLISKRILGVDLSVNKTYQDADRLLNNTNIKRTVQYTHTLRLLDLNEKNAKSLAKSNNNLDQQKAIQKANLAVINSVVSAIEDAAKISIEFSRNIAEVSASFARLDSGGSFAKELRIEQALIRRETELTTKEIDAQIAKIKQAVLLKQNELGLANDLLKSDFGRTATVKQLQQAFEEMDLVQKDGLNAIQLQAAGQLEGLAAQIKNLKATEDNQLALSELNNLLAISNSLHEANLASIDNYASGIQASIAATREFNSESAQILKNFQLLNKAGEFGRQLKVELGGITKEYKIQKEAIAATIELTKIRLKKQQETAGFYDDVLLAELSTKGLLEEQLNIRTDIGDVQKSQLNSIAIAGQQELESLQIQSKQLDKQKEYDSELERMNTLLKLAARTQSDINDLAAGYANAFGDVIKNIGEIINERGSLRTILQPFADAYITSVTKRLSTSLQTYFDDVLESSVGGQLKELEDQLKKKSEAEPYDLGGDIIQRKLIDGAIVTGNIISAKIKEAVSNIILTQGEVVQVKVEIPEIPQLKLEVPVLPALKIEAPDIPPLSFSIPELPKLEIEIPVLPVLKVDLPEIPQLTFAIPVFPKLQVEVPDLPALQVDMPNIPPLTIEIPDFPKLQVEIPDLPTLSVAIPDIPSVTVEVPRIPQLDLVVPDLPTLKVDVPVVPDLVIPELEEFGIRVFEVPTIDVKIPEIPQVTVAVPEFPQLTIAVPELPKVLVDIPNIPPVVVPDIPPLNIVVPDLPTLTVDAPKLYKIAVEIPSIPQLKLLVPELPTLSIKVPIIPELEAPVIPQLQLEVPELPKVVVDIPNIPPVVVPVIPPLTITVPVLPTLTVDIPNIPQLELPRIPQLQLKVPELPTLSIKVPLIPELVAPVIPQLELKVPELPKVVVDIPNIPPVVVPDIPPLNIVVPALPTLAVALPDIPTVTVEIPTIPQLQLQVPDLPTLSIKVPVIPELVAPVIPQLQLKVPELPKVVVDIPNIPTVVVPDIPPLTIIVPELPTLVVPIPEIPQVTMVVPVIPPMEIVVPELPTVVFSVPDIPELSIAVPYIPESIKLDALEAAQLISATLLSGAQVIYTKIAEAIKTATSITIAVQDSVKLDAFEAQILLLDAHRQGAEIMKAKIIEAVQFFTLNAGEGGEEVSVDTNGVQQAITQGAITGANAIGISTNEAADKISTTNFGIPDTITLDAANAKLQLIEGHTIGAEIAKIKLIEAFSSFKIADTAIPDSKEDSPDLSQEARVATTTLVEDQDFGKFTIEQDQKSLAYINNVSAKILDAHTQGAQILYNKIVEAHTTFAPGTGQQALPQVATVGGTTDTFNTTPITDGLTGVTTGVGLLNVSQQEQTEETELTTEEMAKQVNKQRLTISAIQGLGVIMGNLVGGGGIGSGIGASIGGIAGSFLGPVGGAVGSVVGGILGGLFDSAPEVEEPEPFPSTIYEANSDALAKNTEALIRNSQNFDFMKKLLNAPANFIQPAFADVGGGANITVQINAPVGNENAVGKAVYDAVSKVYSNDYRRIGRRG